MLNSAPAFLVYAAFALGVAAAANVATVRPVSDTAPPSSAARAAEGGATEDSELLAIRLRQRADLEAALANARPPVPWTREPPAAYVAPEPAAETALAMSPPLPQLQKPHDTIAKARIEEDGYRRVRIIERGPDGRWRATALRGETEVAVMVDEQGNVSMQ